MDTLKKDLIAYIADIPLNKPEYTVYEFFDDLYKVFGEEIEKKTYRDLQDREYTISQLQLNEREYFYLMEYRDKYIAIRTLAKVAKISDIFNDVLTTIDGLEDPANRQRLLSLMVDKVFSLRNIELVLRYLNLYPNHPVSDSTPKEVAEYMASFVDIYGDNNATYVTMDELCLIHSGQFIHVLSAESLQHKVILEEQRYLEKLRIDMLYDFDHTDEDSRLPTVTTVNDFLDNVQTVNGHWLRPLKEVHVANLTWKEIDPALNVVADNIADQARLYMYMKINGLCDRDATVNTIYVRHDGYRLTLSTIHDMEVTFSNFVYVNDLQLTTDESMV